MSAWVLCAIQSLALCLCAVVVLKLVWFIAIIGAD